MLEAEIKEVESTLYHWRKARQWLFDNPTICTDRDRRDVTRKLMQLDLAIEGLYRHLPDEVVDGDAECPQELAPALAAYLKAAASMAGQDFLLSESEMQAAKVEHCYTFSDNKERAEATVAEWMGSAAMPGALAAQLSDAFEAGYLAAKERF